MNQEATSKPPVAKRLQHELREFAKVSIYLFVCFSALLFYRFALLEEHGESTWRFGFALGKALILGKFMLIGSALHIGERRRTRTPLQAVVSKSVLFLILLLALSVVEAVVVALIHRHPIATSFSEHGTPLQMLASSLVMLLILIPYFTVQVLDAVWGEGAVRRTLLQKWGKSGA